MAIIGGSAIHRLKSLGAFIRSTDKNDWIIPSDYMHRLKKKISMKGNECEIFFSLGYKHHSVRFSLSWYSHQISRYLLDTQKNVSHTREVYPTLSILVSVWSSFLVSANFPVVCSHIEFLVFVQCALNCGPGNDAVFNAVARTNATGDTLSPTVARCVGLTRRRPINLVDANITTIVTVVSFFFLFSAETISHDVAQLSQNYQSRWQKQLWLYLLSSIVQTILGLPYVAIYMLTGLWQP